MTQILQILIPSIMALLGVFLYGHKLGLKKKDEEVDKIQKTAEQEIQAAEEEAAKAKVETQKVQTEAEIMNNTAKIVKAHNQSGDENNTLKEKASVPDVDVASIVSQIVESSRARAEEAQKRYE